MRAKQKQSAESLTNMQALRVLFLAVASLLTSCGGELTYYDYLDSQANYTLAWDDRPLVMNHIENCTGKDYSDVKIAYNIDTIHGRVVTIGDKIFVPNNNLENDTLLHELAHVNQQRENPNFAPEYFTMQTVGFIQGLLTEGRLNGFKDTFLENDAIDYSINHIDCIGGN